MTLLLRRLKICQSLGFRVAVFPCSGIGARVDGRVDGRVDVGESMMSVCLVKGPLVSLSSAEIAEAVRTSLA